MGSACHLCAIGSIIRSVSTCYYNSDRISSLVLSCCSIADQQIELLSYPSLSAHHSNKSFISGRLGNVDHLRAPKATQTRSDCSTSAFASTIATNFALCSNLLLQHSACSGQLLACQFERRHIDRVAPIRAGAHKQQSKLQSRLMICCFTECCRPFPLLSLTPSLM